MDRSVLDIRKTLNAEGIPSPAGKRWNKTTIHQMLANETYTETLLWGVTAKRGPPPVRVEDAFPATVAREEFLQRRCCGPRRPRAGSSPARR